MNVLNKIFVENYLNSQSKEVDTAPLIIQMLIMVCRDFNTSIISKFAYFYILYSLEEHFTDFSHDYQYFFLFDTESINFENNFPIQQPFCQYIAPISVSCLKITLSMNELNPQHDFFLFDIIEILQRSGQLFIVLLK